MDALLRQQYLQAMGIRQWVPRLNLPGAPESKLCERPPGARVLDPQELLADKPLRAEQSPKGRQRSQPYEKSRTKGGESKENKPQSVSARLKLDLDLDSGPKGKRAAVKPKPELKKAALAEETSSSAASPVHTSVLSFNLVFCRFAENDLLIAELPLGASELTVPVRNYLQELLLALGYQNTTEWQDGLFRWPMVNSPHVDQSDNAARETLLASLQAHQDRMPLNRIITLGKVPARLLAATDKDFDEIRGVPQKVHGMQAELLVTHGITSVFEQPTLKAQVWADLSPVVVQS